MSICRVGGIEGGRATRSTSGGQECQRDTMPHGEKPSRGHAGETLGDKRVTIIKKSGG
jgi:hypothetical protein